MAITREEIVSVLGPTDETLIAELMARGASFEGTVRSLGLAERRRSTDG
jgi:hypothetical protein